MMAERPEAKYVDTEFRGDWRAEAACRSSNPDIFFPQGQSDIALEQTAAAIAICAICKVQPECLQYALETNQKIGIWGGVTEDKRRLLRKRMLVTRRSRER